MTGFDWPIQSPSMDLSVSKGETGAMRWKQSYLIYSARTGLSRYLEVGRLLSSGTKQCQEHQRVKPTRRGGDKR